MKTFFYFYSNTKTDQMDISNLPFIPWHDWAEALESKNNHEIQMITVYLKEYISKIYLRKIICIILNYLDFCKVSVDLVMPFMFLIDRELFQD